MGADEQIAMLNIDLLGHLFYATILIGMIGVSWKSRYGWAFRFAGELGWVWIGIVLDLSSIYSWGIIFMMVDLYSYWSWTTDPPE